MNVDRMLEMCHRDQWRMADLEWNREPRKFSRDDEIAIVQLFTDMAGIERLAGALFAQQEKRATDPRLREIFRSFVRDEARHAAVAERLAEHYDVHKYKTYTINPDLARFTPHFVNAIRFLSDDIANVYITVGELVLDVALLRSINDYVNDDMSQAAMHLINRDESRHIAVDYHMTEYYASPAYLETLASRPRPSLTQRLRAWWTFANVIYHLRPFGKAVFFDPMDRVDPTGLRIKEAFKRMQLLGLKPGVADRPFVKFMTTIHSLFNHPIAGPLFGRVLIRIAGLDPRIMVQLYTDAECERAQKMSFEELAQDALGAKFAH